MLTFFRRIRKGLLDGGRTSKYLLYAIGEIALVVIGILIALQINNWNEWRKDRVEEKMILREIASNIQTNIKFLQESMEFEKGWSNAYSIMMDVIKQDLTWHDSLKYHARPALRTRVPTLSFSAYESMKNKGIDLILSDQIQKDIVDLYETNYKDLMTVMNRIVNIEMRPIMAEFVLAQFERGPENEGRNVFIPNDPEELLANQRYLNLLTHAEGYRNKTFFKHQSRSLEQSEKVLYLIKDELGEHEIQ